MLVNQAQNITSIKKKGWLVIKTGILSQPIGRIGNLLITKNKTIKTIK